MDRLFLESPAAGRTCACARLSLVEKLRQWKEVLEDRTSSINIS
jgi:hypothetical protein